MVEEDALVCRRFVVPGLAPGGDPAAVRLLDRCRRLAFGVELGLLEDALGAEVLPVFVFESGRDYDFAAVTEQRPVAGIELYDGVLVVLHGRSPGCGRRGARKRAGGRAVSALSSPSVSRKKSSNCRSFSASQAESRLRSMLMPACHRPTPGAMLPPRR